MATATCGADRVARRFFGVVGAALVTRRLRSLPQLRRCLTWQRARLGAVGATLNAAGPTIHVVVPLYQEQILVPSIVAFWRTRCEADDRLRVLLVTTAKEGSAPDGTAELVRRSLAQAPAGVSVEHLHVDEVHDFRAAQLNAAVEAIRRSTDVPTEATWIGVYNADSQPCGSTFDELRAAIESSTTTRAYQQLVQYVVPQSRPSSMFMEAFATLQTWWTYTTYYTRNTRARSSVGWWARTSPYSTFGHGEFFRLDLLDEIGGFPDFAYADGLLVGWLVRFHGDDIGLLASPDFAEVPRSPWLIVGQHRAWIRGLLNVLVAARVGRLLGAGRLRRAERRALIAAHLAIPVTWGLRSPIVALEVLWAAGQVARGSKRDGALVLAALALFGLVPQLASPTFRRLPGDDAATLSRRSLDLRQLAGAPLTLVLDGLGFWPAARDAAGSHDSAPPKTPR